MAQEGRQRWTSRPAFILAAVGSAVGLGNIWRFPYQAFEHGGGAFFIPYFVALVTAGIPLVIVEYAIGQKYQGGAPQALASVTKKFRWVGWFALLVGTTIVLYYVPVMGYAWHYAVSSIQVAWTEPAPKTLIEETQAGPPRQVKVPPDRVKLYMLARSSEEEQRLEELQKTKYGEDQGGGLLVLREDELEQRRQEQEGVPRDEKLHYVSLGENVQNFFHEQCLGGFNLDLWKQQSKWNRGVANAGAGGKPREEAAGEVAYLSDMFGFVPHLAVGAFVIWLLIFLIIYRGVHSVGKVVMVTVPLPLILLVLLFLRGITLPGSIEGIIYYLRPEWEMLQNPKVWIAAYGQIFFSLSLGFGILIAYASYMPEESDVANSAFITSFGNCATSFFGGLIVFSVLGYLSFLHGTPVEDVVAAGPGLVFVTYPVALAKMPMAQTGIAIMSLIFFLCLITLGIDSAFSIVEGIVTAFGDSFRSISKPMFTGIICVFGFFGSLFFATRSGMMWLDILDNWMSNYGLALVGLLECVAVGYFYDIEDLKTYINRHSEIKVHYWFDLCIKFITPGVLIFLLASQFLQDITTPYGGYDEVLEYSVVIAGWGVFSFLILLALALGRAWKKLSWAFSGAAIFVALIIALRWASGKSIDSLVGPASMGAAAMVLLFGGLLTCIYIARKTGHPAGLSTTDEEGEA